MGSNVFMRNPLWANGRFGLAIIGGCAAALGGCSADVARFDFGPNALNDRSQQTASISRPSEPMAPRSNLLGNDSPTSQSASPPTGQHTDGGAYIPAPSMRPRGVQVAALPDVPQPAAAGGAALAPTATDTTRSSPAPMAAAASSSEKGEQIEVQRGDTLFGLSKRHKVPVTELMSVNNLNGPALKPGQKLYLPAGRAVADSKPAAKAPVAVAAAVERPADWNGSYTVKSGDALYNIARQNKIKLEDLQRYNGITDVRKVKPGMVLHVPGSAAPAAVIAEAPATTQNGGAVSVTPPPEAVKDAVAASTPTGAPPAAAKVLNASPQAGDKVAALGPSAATASATASDATASAPAEKTAATGTPPAAAGKLRWPAQGKIISSFGPRPDGTHNDGVNLAVPMGTEIHAAEEGTVAYAGSELKGYGNLILLRHDNGWVTAYAHSDELMVKRGDRVKRGQVIAKSGKTGSVDQPQVHFEVRQGQKPVDPTPFMEKI